MKLNKEFIVHVTDNESILVPTGKAAFSGIVQGNKTLGAVLELLQQETDETAVVNSLCDRFDAPRERIMQDVKRVLDQLREIGALDE